MEMATTFGNQSKTLTKVDRYGWTIKDQPGFMKEINKSLLNVDMQYQRHANKSKVLTISSEWSWIACGVVVVAFRDGKYWVMDGQHRVMAAKQRADINNLPCIVFESSGVEQEARGFLDVNTGRKAMSSIDKFKASIAAGNETANFVKELTDQLGIQFKHTTTNAREMKSVGWCMKRALENKKAFSDVLHLAAEICHDQPIQERLLDGIFYIHTNGLPVTNHNIRKHFIRVGANRLTESAIKASAYYSRGGAKVWADGMLQAINKGLHNRLSISTSE